MMKRNSKKKEGGEACKKMIEILKKEEGKEAIKDKQIGKKYNDMIVDGRDLLVTMPNKNINR